VFSQLPAVDLPLKLALNFLGDIDAHYATGNIYLAEPIVKQAMLARHVLGKRKSFEDWMKTVLRRATEVFPRKAEYDETTKKYDASGEARFLANFLIRTLRTPKKRPPRHYVSSWRRLLQRGTHICARLMRYEQRASREAVRLVGGRSGGVLGSSIHRCGKSRRSDATIQMG
jgi:hypothetical protein